MIQIVLTVCLISSPSDCKTVRLQYIDQNATPQQLLHMAQPAAADWIEAHPGYRVTRISFARAGLASKA